MTTPRTEQFVTQLVDLATDSTSIGNCILKKVRVHTVMSAHACLIEDSGTALWTLPASSAVGTEIDMGDVSVSALAINPDDLGTGKVLVTYVAL